MARAVRGRRCRSSRGGITTSAQRKAAGGYPGDDALLSRAAGEYGASATGEEVVRPREWAMSTDTGDRDDLVPGVSDRAWRQVSISKPNASAIRVHYVARASLFSADRRRRMRTSSLPITRFLPKSGGPFFRARVPVIDEAHDPVDRVYK